MKKKTRNSAIILLVVFLFTFVSPISFAKPQYCEDAYWGCKSDCQWLCLASFMYWGVCVGGCDYGCSVGYNNCGG